MRIWAGTIFGLGLCMGLASAWAHGASRQKVVETIDINAPVEKVWAIVKDFDALAKWHPAVASSVADKGNEVGSIRTVVLKAPGDPKIIETLLSYDDGNHAYHYEIKDVDVRVLPISNYASWLAVSDNGHGGSTVEWKAAFFRGDQNFGPPPQLNDDAAIAAVKSVYRPGLDNLKTLAERK